MFSGNAAPNYWALKSPSESVSEHLQKGSKENPALGGQSAGILRGVSVGGTLELRMRKARAGRFLMAAGPGARGTVPDVAPCLSRKTLMRPDRRVTMGFLDRSLRDGRPWNIPEFG